MGSGGKLKTSGVTETEKKLSPEQQELLNLAMPTFRSFLQPGAVDLHPGSRVAKTDPLSTLGQEMVLATAGAGGDLSNVAKSASKGSQFLTSPDILSPETNPFLQQAVEAALRPIDTRFGETLGNITDEAFLAGGIGGSRQGVAEALATRDYLRQVGDTSATLLNTAYGQGLDALGRGLLTAPSIAQLSALPGALTEAVGVQRQDQAQAELSDEVSRFMEEQLLPLLIAEDIVGLSFGIPAGTATTTEKTRGKGLFDKIMQGISTAASVASVAL